ncbi:hypothetical protein [Streptomyces sp. CoT10]|uniref:hypothetical protein n=1 Tax=Streptomyces sp. CoT10 TaxID=2875762 RepID=UPI0027E0FF06|nr:hypothetical protein [Streptomyces sp. CoT10]
MLVGGLPEGAEQEGGLPDGGQALAAHVTDHHAGRAVGAGGGVEVAADLGFLLGGQIEAGELQRAQSGGKRPQQDVLGGLGHRPHPGQLAPVPVTCHAEEDDHRRQHRQSDHPDQHVPRQQQAVPPADEPLGHDCQGTDAAGHPGTFEPGGERGRDHQQGPEDDVGRRHDVQGGDQHDERDRYQQHEVARMPRLPQARHTLIPRAHD